MMTKNNNTTTTTTTTSTATKERRIPQDNPPRYVISVFQATGGHSASSSPSLSPRGERTTLPASSSLLGDVEGTGGRRRGRERAVGVGVALWQEVILCEPSAGAGLPSNTNTNCHKRNSVCPPPVATSGPRRDKGISSSRPFPRVKKHEIVSRRGEDQRQTATGPVKGKLETIKPPLVSEWPKLYLTSFVLLGLDQWQRRLARLTNEIKPRCLLDQWRSRGRGAARRRAQEIPTS
ncbi:hypothetical protein E2C01_062524 [Portunus trituberculatus]|uniref:Uncharacterized protein n=1 Tax=Portunus trituberculatus TaxID=210409 RepID=A0A5B7HI95_PORTR|nr:hypothetical protein [Portunus trituberculatus]